MRMSLSLWGGYLEAPRSASQHPGRASLSASGFSLPGIFAPSAAVPQHLRNRPGRSLFQPEALISMITKTLFCLIAYKSPRDHEFPGHLFEFRRGTLSKPTRPEISA
jgi:hypothetical protein